MKVLYLLNYAGKAGTERYVETLVRYLNHTRVEAYFAYNEGGLLVERPVSYTHLTLPTICSV